MKTIKIGSDFSGVGAFDYAIGRIAKQKDFKIDTIFACDWDKYARITYAHNHGEPKYYPKDVYEREIPEESLDIYMTSPPCQAFSLAGNRKGKADKRGILFFNSHEFIQKNKPRFFIFENVKGLLSDDNGNTFQEWINMLGGKSVNGLPILFPYENSVPYHLYWQVLNTKKHGVPQNRERVFIIGIRDDQDNYFQFPKEEHLKLKLKDILEEEIFEKFYLSEKAVERLCKNDSGFISEPKDENDIASTICASDFKIARGMNVLKVKSNLDKYYLSDDMVKNLLVYNDRQVENDRGFSAKFRDIDNVDTMDALKVGGGGKDDLIKVKSATPSGYEIATDEDSINFSIPNSETRRGRVGKGVSQTLDTKCNQGVIVSKEVRTEKAKKNRKNTGSNDFRDKEIEFREQEFMNTITTSLTNDHLIGDYRSDEGFRWREDGTSPAIMAMTRDTWKPNFTGQNPPIVKNEFRIRRLTPRECFRLQDFPDIFDFSVVSDSQAYKQAGNSITVRVLEKILDKLHL